MAVGFSKVLAGSHCDQRGSSRKSGRRESNPQHWAWKAHTLPIELRPHGALAIAPRILPHSPYLCQMIPVGKTPGLPRRHEETKFHEEDGTADHTTNLVLRVSS